MVMTEDDDYDNEYGDDNDNDEHDDTLQYIGRMTDKCTHAMHWVYDSLMHCTGFTTHSCNDYGIAIRIVTTHLCQDILY